MIASSSSYHRPWNVTEPSRSSRTDDLERLLEPADAVVERVAERRVLGLVPAAAEAEDQPAAGDFVGGRRHLREQARRPEAGREHERPDLDPFSRQRPAR